MCTERYDPCMILLSFSFPFRFLFFFHYMLGNIRTNQTNRQYVSFSGARHPRGSILVFDDCRILIIQQIVTLSKNGHDALDICHP